MLRSARGRRGYASVSVVFSILFSAASAGIEAGINPGIGSVVDPGADCSVNPVVADNRFVTSIFHFRVVDKRGKGARK